MKTKKLQQVILLPATTTEVVCGHRTAVIYYHDRVRCRDMRTSARLSNNLVELGQDAINTQCELILGD